MVLGKIRKDEHRFYEDTKTEQRMQPLLQHIPIFILENRQKAVAQLYCGVSSFSDLSATARDYVNRSIDALMPPSITGAAIDQFLDSTVSRDPFYAQVAAADGFDVAKEQELIKIIADQSDDKETVVASDDDSGMSTTVHTSASAPSAPITSGDSSTHKIPEESGVSDKDESISSIGTIGTQLSSVAIDTKSGKKFPIIGAGGVAVAIAGMWYVKHKYGVTLREVFGALPTADDYENLAIFNVKIQNIKAARRRLKALGVFGVLSGIFTAYQLHNDHN